MNHVRVGTEPIDLVSIVAQVAHESVRGYRNVMHALFPEQSEPGFESMPPWADASEEQTEAARGLVLFMIQNPHFDLETARKNAPILQDVTYVAIASARQCFAAMGLTFREMPASDRADPAVL